MNEKTKKGELPEGWSWAKLGGKKGVAKIINGSTPSTNNPEYWDGDILWATPSDLGKLNSIYLDNTKRKITKAGVDSCSTTLLPAGTVLLTSRAPVGNITITKNPICTNQGFKSFIPNDGINNLYLYFAIKRIVPDIQKQSHGNTFTEITKELIQNFEIPLPPTLNDQKRIANEIERKIAEADKMRQAALSQKEAINAMQGAILREVFPYNEGDELPEGWRWEFLGNSKLITLIMGQSPPGETYNKEKIGLPFFQGCTDFGDIHPEPTVWCSKPKKIAEPRDILLSVRAPVGPINIAKEKCCIGRGLAALRCKEGLSYKYLKWILLKFEKQISSGGSGSIFNAIGRDEIKNVAFPHPPILDDQKRITNELERKMDEIDKLRKAAETQLEAAEALQGAILRDVFDFKET